LSSYSFRRLTLGSKLVPAVSGLIGESAVAQRAQVSGRRVTDGAKKVTQYCSFVPHRLTDLTFAQKREVLDAFQAQFTLDKDGELRILLVLPTSETVSFYTTLRHASA
jgi:hypothetical protein